jgi:hypothetical protein
LNEPDSVPTRVALLSRGFEGHSRLLVVKGDWVISIAQSRGPTRGGWGVCGWLLLSCFTFMLAC